MKSIILIFTFLYIITTGCGFKVVKQNEFLDFDIAEIETRGDSEINYKIKNKLLSSAKKNEKKLITIVLETKKTKKVKEKNIKNQITKYQITLNSYVKLNISENNKKEEFNIISTGNYQVSDKYSTTLKNEKRLIDDLTNDISDKIKKRINLILNDL